jgi:hypothetical protein
VKCVTRVLAILLASSLAAWCSLQQPDAATIVRHSVAANEEDWKAAPRYDYFEKDTTENGNKVYSVTMIGGSPYEELVENNGEPLSPQDVQRQQRKRKDAMARRRLESAGERMERIAKYRKERNRVHLLEQEMARAFDFKLLSDERLGSNDVYVLQAVPKAGYRAPNAEAQVLTAMKGMLWIDKASWQWVKVTAEVMHPVWIGGFLARVEPGTRFELEKAPVGNGIWLPRHFTMSAKAAILFMFHRHDQEDVAWYNYREETGNR